MRRPEPRFYVAGVGLSSELCRFFEEIKASILLDGHLRAGPMRFPPPAKMPPFVSFIGRTEHALRTKAPAVVPASRCAPDPKSSRKAATRGKRRGQKKAR